MNEQPLSLEFTNACFQEMCGSQMMDSALSDRPNLGPAYKVRMGDQTSDVLSKSLFIERTMQTSIGIFSNASFSNADKAVHLMTALVACVKFGLYLQRKVNERGGLIL